MTPEQRIAKLEETVRQLQAQLQALGAFASIPFPVEKAFRNRLGIDGLPVMSLSATSANAHDVTVNESGSASYTVMDDPAGFLQMTVNGTKYDIPYFTQ